MRKLLTFHPTAEEAKTHAPCVVGVRNQSKRATIILRAAAITPNGILNSYRKSALQPGKIGLQKGERQKCARSSNRLRPR